MGARVRGCVGVRVRGSAEARERGTMGARGRGCRGDSIKSAVKKHHGYVIEGEGEE